MLCECEKALADQVMSLDFLDSGIEGDVIWFGCMLDKSGSEYIGSTYDDGLKSAPVEQSEFPNLGLTVLTAVPVIDQSSATLADHAGRADYIIFTKRIPPKPPTPPRP